MTLFSLDHKYDRANPAKAGHKSSIIKFQSSIPRYSGIIATRRPAYPD